jgi:hypothetical protein
VKGKRLLCIDCASLHTQVGVLVDGCWLSFQKSQDSTVECVDLLLRDVLDQGKMTCADADGLVVCKGPGGLLGLRVVKMLVDIWNKLGPPKPVYAYNALCLAAEELLARGLANFNIVSPVQKNVSAVLRVTDTVEDTCEFIPTNKLPQDHPSYTFPMHSLNACIDYDLHKLGIVLEKIIERIVPQHSYDLLANRNSL